MSSITNPTDTSNGIINVPPEAYRYIFCPFCGKRNDYSDWSFTTFNEGLEIHTQTFVNDLRMYDTVSTGYCTHTAEIEIDRCVNCGCELDIKIERHERTEKSEEWFTLGGLGRHNFKRHQYL